MNTCMRVKWVNLSESPSLSCSATETVYLFGCFFPNLLPLCFTDLRHQSVLKLPLTVLLHLSLLIMRWIRQSMIWTITCCEIVSLSISLHPHSLLLSHTPPPLPQPPPLLPHLTHSSYLLPFTLPFPFSHCFSEPKLTACLSSLECLT